ncbi:di/tricarboxylate transporter [Sporomusaceae bacterium BoRhaA]|uniref:SLC13 family permease n=1 Tax=Pelorhabdus rhamnosifermentans TaxID=2772457 RepID=UPI001C06210A|nr:SLC13 family permease [Pelorhabdus rhamnosifermentans]MBU2703990.1 di/tricarboxylate transporter [Pelorhabdus rhamnosifermentans]
MELIALLFLIGAIAFGIVRNINVGLVSIGLSIVLAMIGHIDVKTVFAGFPTQLFVTLLGTMFLFSQLQNNQTLKVFSNKIVSLVGDRIFLIPIVVYLFSYVLSAAGPGALSVLPIAVILAVSLAIQMEISPIMMGTLGALGAVGGTLSPIAMTGIIVQGLLSAQNIPGMQTQLFFCGGLINFSCAVLVYFYFKGYKLKPNIHVSVGENPDFNIQQKLSLVALLVLVVSVIGFKMDVGLVSFTIALVLIALKAADEQAAIKLVPWSVLIMVCGVNVLMNVTQKLGGIKLLANILASFMNEITVAPIMGFTSGIMAQFSSANGVVIPTLVPTVADIVAQIGGNANIHEIVFAIVVCSVLTMSPLSTAGALIMASYTQGKQVDEHEQNRLFGQLFIVSFILLGLAIIASLIGVYKPFSHFGG